MKIGALWLKEKDGKKYFSGKIEVPGLDLQLAIFRNEDKQKENQPDFNIVWSPPKKDGGYTNSTPDVMDDIPI